MHSSSQVENIQANLDVLTERVKRNSYLPSNTLDQISGLLAEMRNVAQRPAEQTSPHQPVHQNDLVKPYKECNFEVYRAALNLALNAKSATQLAIALLLMFCTVSDVYRRSVSGSSPRVPRASKKNFVQKIKFDFLDRNYRSQPVSRFRPYYDPQSPFGLLD